MPRNQEVIRQWKLLHALESSRHGASIDALSKELEVTTRTIRRDLAALQEAGFALYDDATPKPTPEEIEARRVERVYRAAATAAGTPDRRRRREIRRFKEGGRS